jgi:RIO kinase 1
MSDEFDGPDERFGGRKDRRRPKGGKRRGELVSATGPESGSLFQDPGLRSLQARGILVGLGRQVRGGKEATVYRAEGAAGPLAAKVYSDAEVRDFRADRSYLAGRRIADRRIRKMLGDSRRRALSPELAHWVYHEYLMLWRLHGAGLAVPRPAVGPEADAMIEAGRVVLMEWIGDEEPAPRLADVELGGDDAESAWRQARRFLTELLEMGLVHGDLSTFNLLWWQGRALLIDLPQTVEARNNPHAADLLERDVKSLCSSFSRHGLALEPGEVLLEVRLETGHPPSGPLNR